MSRTDDFIRTQKSIRQNLSILEYSDSHEYQAQDYIERFDQLVKVSPLSSTNRINEDYIGYLLEDSNYPRSFAIHHYMNSVFASGVIATELNMKRIFPLTNYSISQSCLDKIENALSESNAKGTLLLPIIAMAYSSMGMKDFKYTYMDMMLEPLIRSLCVFKQNLVAIVPPDLYLTFSDSVKYLCKVLDNYHTSGNLGFYQKKYKIKCVPKLLLDDYDKVFGQIMHIIVIDFS